MNRRIALGFIILLVMASWAYLAAPLRPCAPSLSEKSQMGRPQLLLVQRWDVDGKKPEESSDPHLIQVLKKLSEQLDEWLKSINERIESEDVTRLEVRFLEILRNILEWFKEKVDAKIEDSEREKPLRKERKGLLRETPEIGCLLRLG